LTIILETLPNVSIKLFRTAVRLRMIRHRSGSLDLTKLAESIYDSAEETGPSIRYESFKNSVSCDTFVIKFFRDLFCFERFQRKNLDPMTITINHKKNIFVVIGIFW
jgi:hypothetical protein